MGDYNEAGGWGREMRRGKGMREGEGEGEGEREDVGKKAAIRDHHCIPEREAVSPVGETTAKKQDTQ